MEIKVQVLLLKPCLRIDEAAIVLGVAPRTVQHYLATGKLTPVLGPGGRKRIRTEELKKYL